jgi:hypothetical protein
MDLHKLLILPVQLESIVPVIDNNSNKINDI